jgi:hypothetical protein
MKPFTPKINQDPSPSRVGEIIIDFEDFEQGGIMIN